MRHHPVLAYCLPVVFVLASQAQTAAKPPKVHVELVQMGPVSCEDSSMILDLQRRVKNVSATPIRIGKVAGEGARFYSEEADGNLRLRRTVPDGDIKGGPPFDIIAGRYEVPDEPLLPGEVKTYTAKSGFLVEPEDVQVVGENRKIISSVQFSNVLPNTSFGGVDWKVWSDPVTIWLPKDCELFPGLHQH
jgi:hypothetical protein